MFKYIFNNKYNKYNTFNILKSNYTDDSKLSNEINGMIDYNTKVGNMRHHPPLVRVWNNSVYNFYKSNQDNSFTKYNRLYAIIKSYFNLNNNITLARSKRMRYLRRKSVAKKLFIARPEIKQTNDKIIITIYYFDRLKHSFSRKTFFFNRPFISKYLLKKKYSKRKLIRKTKWLKKRIRYSGVKNIKELKSFKDKNSYKNKYIEQSLWLYFLKYILSLLNIQIYNPMYLSNDFINKKNKFQYIKLLMKKERLKINKIVNSNSKILFWINFNNFSFEKIDNTNITYAYLTKKLINEYKHSLKNISINKNKLLRLNFLTHINKKLWTLINSYYIKSVLSQSIVLKAYNLLSLKVYKNFTRKMFNRQYNMIYKLTYSYMLNIIKFKNLLPSLKMIIDTFYNKKTELNMVNLKYFFLHADIFAQTLIAKLKKKISPGRLINKSLGKVRVFLQHNVRKQILLNNMNKLYNLDNLSLQDFPINVMQNNVKSKFINTDLIQKVFNKLFPTNLLQKYNKTKSVFNNKITNILNNIKYKGILGIRVEAKGRLTRRHKSARSVFLVSYKGNLKDEDKYYNEQEKLIKNKSIVLTRNDVRANTQYTFKASFRRIGSFGIKTWISAK